MMKKFEMICRKSQKGLKKYVAEELKKTHNNIISGDGYVFAKGTFPVCLVAHLDTVHEKLPGLILYDEATDAISSPEGIGGDDRCGVYMILEIIKRYNCSVLFCEDEEIGAVGAEKFIESPAAYGLEFNYMLEFDRKNANDAVFYDCDNDEFEDFITDNFYKFSTGTFSDISVLAPYFGCAAANLSCGYYNAHTKNEYVVMKEMKASIEAACDILARTTENDVYEYVEMEYNYKGSWTRGGGYVDDDALYLEEYYYIIEYVDKRGNVEWYDTIACSEAEAIGKFCMEFPNLTYGNVIDIMVDKGMYVR